MLFWVLVIFSLTFICSEIGWQYHSQSKCIILFMAIVLQKNKWSLGEKEK